jgi:hypothetical protein
MPTKFSSLAVTISDGNTVPSIIVDGTPYYVDIGSGTVLRVSWATPTATDNAVDKYSIYIAAQDTISNTLKVLLNTHIGNVNEYYITSDMLSTINNDKYKLTIQVIARSKYGSNYDSPPRVVYPYVCKGCGTYVKVTDGYKQPIMKRAVAFTKLGYVLLQDAEGKTLYDADNKALYAKISSTQDTETDWALMKKFYSKDSNGAWHESDIQYEVLTDSNGEIITDSSNNPIYTL